MKIIWRSLVLVAMMFAVPLLFEIESTGLRWLAVAAFLALFALVAEWVLLPVALRRDHDKRKGVIR